MVDQVLQSYYDMEIYEEMFKYSISTIDIYTLL